MKNINITETAVCYLRSAVSDEDGYGLSLAEQEEACRRFAALHGLTICATYRDVGSGLKINPGLRGLVDGLHTQPVGQIITTNLSRLSRAGLLEGTLRQLFRDAGVRLRVVDREKS
jgi:DNA invertase Pin-like site-specific DNA recombinase